MQLIIRDKQKNEDLPINVDPGVQIGRIKQDLAARKGVPAANLRFYFLDELVLDDELTLGQLGVQNGNHISVVTTSGQMLMDPILLEAQTLIQRSQKNPDYLNKMMETDLPFAELLVSENVKLVEQALRQKRGMPATFSSQARPPNEPPTRPTPPPPSQANPWIPQSNPLQPPPQFAFQQPPAPGPTQNAHINDPRNYSLNNSFGDIDINAQKKIEETIRMNRIRQLQQHAYDNYPELFVQTQMLFITGKVNKITTEVFVDTGAQVTIVSKAFAERAGLMKDVDTRMVSQVRGVGAQTSLGRIYMMELFIGDRVFVLSATVLEKFDHDVLLGLDMMKRHKCIIDLASHQIRFGSEGVVAKFMSDHEISQMKERQNMETIEQLQKLINVNTGDAMRLLEITGFDIQKAADVFRSGKWQR